MSWGGGGHVTDSDNTKVKHFAPINSNNDLCCIRKEKGYVIVFSRIAFLIELLLCVFCLGLSETILEL